MHRRTFLFKMKWNIFVFLLIIAIGSCTDENSEKSEDTTDKNDREMRTLDREVGICLLYLVSLYTYHLLKSVHTT